MRILDNLWIGGAYDEVASPADAVLNVAHDLMPTRDRSDGTEYVHIGLIDGPGNLVEAYIAAVLALAVLLSRRRRVLVCCHEGQSRSVAVAMMYLRLVRQDDSMNWDKCLEILNERLDSDLPPPNKAHQKAFNRIPWGLLQRVLKASAHAPGVEYRGK